MMVKFSDIVMRTHLEQIEDYLALAEEFHIGIEYGDFCMNSVIADEEEYIKRIDLHKRLTLPLGLERTLHTPFRNVNPHSIDPKIRARSRKLLHQSLRTAEELECSRVVIHSVYNQHHHSEDELNRITDDFVPFLEELLEEYSPLLCVENIRDKNTALLERIARAIDHPRLGFCMDVGHMSAFGNIPIESWFETFGNRIFHNHWHDNLGDRDAHHPLGAGSVEWQNVVTMRDTYCPKSTIALEVRHGHGVRESLKTLSPYIEKR